MIASQLPLFHRLARLDVQEFAYAYVLLRLLECSKYLFCEHVSDVCEVGYEAVFKGTSRNIRDMMAWRPSQHGLGPEIDQTCVSPATYWKMEGGRRSRKPPGNRPETASSTRLRTGPCSHRPDCLFNAFYGKQGNGYLSFLDELGGESFIPSHEGNP